MEPEADRRPGVAPVVDHGYQRGIRVNLHQFLQHGLQLFFVGLMIGMERNVLPLISREFGVAKSSFLYLMAFVVSFGLVKAVLNFVASHLSERIGRKRVLLIGWLAALPIPFLILYGHSWMWVVVANVFLGLNQGLAWTMAVTSNVDLSRASQRGFATGFNEFAGYAAVGLGGMVIGYGAALFGPRLALFWFALSVTLLAGMLGKIFLRDTLPWARAEHQEFASGRAVEHMPRFPVELGANARARDVFLLVSFRHPTFSAFCQAGTVNKIADSLLWVLFPLYLHERGLDAVHIGWVVAVYGLIWGVFQLFTGAMSDWIGRRNMIIAGQWVLALGVMMVLQFQGLAWWLAAAAVMGLGMALGYANLIAAVADISRPGWRSLALGAYRFWRDIGYVFGGVLLGAVAQSGARLEPAFWLTASLLVVSGGVVLWRAEETHPRLNPALP